MSDTTKENIFENENIINEYFPEESIESKIRGHQEHIDQLQRTIEVSDDEIINLSKTINFNSKNATKSLKTYNFKRRVLTLLHRTK